MHPLFRSPVRMLLYLAAWTPVMVALAMVLQLLEPRPTVDRIWITGPMVFLFAIECLSPWWILKGETPGRGPWGRLILKLSGATLATACGWVLMGTVWYWKLGTFFHHPISNGVRARDLMVFLLAGLLLYALSAALHVAFLMATQAREAERLVLESRVAAREAELRALRSQLNPHFLFNSLNSINALVGREPEAARRMCEGLGDFLRRTLNLGARDRVTLGEELALVDQYLEIERVRFGDRLSVDRRIDSDLGACLIPPLLLQPLVENAVKFGVAARLEGGLVIIAACRLKDHLQVDIENPCDADTPGRPGEGVGIENVRRRLRAFDPDRTRMEITQEPGRFAVRLLLPFTTAPTGAPA